MDVIGYIRLGKEYSWMVGYHCKNNQDMKKILDIVRIPATILGGLGLIYTIYIHLNAIDYADISEGDNIPGYLHVVLIAVWATAIGVVITRQNELKVENPNFETRLKLFYKTMFGEAPALMIIVSIGTILYAYYFGWTHSLEGVTSIIDGKLVLHNHGNIIEELSDAKFLQYKAEEIKLSTSNSMVFYGVGTGILFPRLKKNS